MQEAVSLVATAISFKVFFTSPSLAADLVGNNIWYMTLISASTAILGFTFIYLLLRRFPDQDITAIFSETLGKPIGFICSAFLCLYLFYAASSSITEFTEVMRDYIYLLTPSSIIIGIFVVAVMTLCLLGLESIARLARFLIFPMLFGVLLVLVLGFKNFHINRLFPILGHGTLKTLTNGITRSSAYGEIVILAVVAPSLQGIAFVKKAGYTSLILSGLFISMLLLTFALTYPYYVAREITSLMYGMATLIDYGRFLQRVEPLFLFVWFLSPLIGISGVFYCFISVYCKMFKISDSRPIVVGSSIVLFAVCLFQSDLGAIASATIQSIRNFGWIPAFALPILALVIGGLRKKGTKYHV